MGLDFLAAEAMASDPQIWLPRCFCSRRWLSSNAPSTPWQAPISRHVHACACSEMSNCCSPKPVHGINCAALSPLCSINTFGKCVLSKRLLVWSWVFFGGKNERDAAFSSQWAGDGFCLV